MSEERCVLCNKPYEYEHYHLFGRGCLKNVYDLLNISNPPRGTKDKEMYLCNRIAWRNHKFFLSSRKKYTLTQKYVAIKYLDKINFNKYPYTNKSDIKEVDYNSFLDDVKEKISKDIKSISLFSSKIIETVSFRLHDIYELYNNVQRFEEIIKEIQNMNLEELDENIASGFLECLKFAFDITKRDAPILYDVYYVMQYMFWQIVVAGGLLADMKLSARLLTNSLCWFGEEPEDILIDSGDTITTIVESEEFKSKVKFLIEKYCNNGNIFESNSEENKDCSIEFNKHDLLYAIHGSPTFIRIEKGEKKGWNIDIKISDTYDFTDFKNLKKYFTSNNSIPTSLLSTTLNNLGVVSSKYGVLKTYQVTINIKLQNYEIEE